MKVLKLRIFIIILLFVLNNLSSFAQNNTRLDSLLNSFKQEQQDTNKIRTLLRIGDVYEYTKPDSALTYYNKALNIAEKIKSEDNIALCSYYIGIIYQSKSEYDKAMEYYVRAVKLYEQINNKRGMAFAYNTMGIVNTINNNKVKAKEYFTNALDICIEINDKFGMANAYGNIGTIYEETGNFNKAKEYNIKVLEIYKELNDKLRIGYTYNNLGVIEKNQSNYSRAIEYHTKSLKIAEGNGDTSGIVTNYINIASLYYIIAEEDSISNAEKERNLKETVNYGLLAYNIAKRLNYKLEVKDLSLILKNTYYDIGDYEKSIEFSNIYIATKDSIFNIDKAKALTEMEVKYKSEKNKLRIENLEKEKQNNRNIFFFLISILLLLLIIGAIILIQKSRLKKAYNKIVEENIKAIDWKKQLDKLSKNKNNEVKPKLDIKYSESGLSENKKTDIYNAIVNAMEVQKLFLNPNFKSKDIAEYLKISQTYISQVLNERFNLSFTNLINKYRVEEAKKMFLDKKNNNLTIDGISQNAGFNSVKTFNRVFKKLSGVTPSYFRESASERQ